MSIDLEKENIFLCKVLFRRVYDRLRQNRRLVYISDLRQIMARFGINVIKFNRIISELDKAQIIQLHGGDSSAMTNEQIKNSFELSSILYITLSYIGVRRG